MADWSDYILRCWELAENSDCRKMQFGAVLVLDDKVIGEGFNHVPHPSLLDLCEPCIRENIQSGTRLELCAALHAEQDAILSAHQAGIADLSKATLYIAGKFLDGKRLIKSEKGMYCTFCSRIIAKENIDDIRVPTKQGEAALTLMDVLRTSFQYARGLKKIEYAKDSE